MVLYYSLSLSLSGTQHIYTDIRASVCVAFTTTRPEEGVQFQHMVQRALGLSFCRLQTLTITIDPYLATSSFGYLGWS